MHSLAPRPHGSSFIALFSSGRRADHHRHPARRRSGFAGNARSRRRCSTAWRGGRVFTDAHAHNVVTLPSHANILTGLYPYQHGVRDNSGFTLPARVPTLATVLHEAGYATGAFVGAYPARLAVRPRPRLRRLRRPLSRGLDAHASS